MKHDSFDGTVGLSDRERREALRTEMIEAFVALHRTRRLQRRVGLSVGLLALAAGTAWVGANWPGPSGGTGSRTTGAIATAIVETIESPASGKMIEFAYVGAGPSPFVSTVEGPSPLVQILDDAGLVETLAKMDRAAGLIRIGDTLRLTRDVVDERQEDAAPIRGSGMGLPLDPGNTRPSAGV